ncbi:MAG: NAD(P)/FAD-dependent oxidoreductase [Dehalococcoidia bacterium]
MAKESYDVIVVGAGFGGSSCAALLAKRGLRVLLLDKNAKAGGKAMALSKKGFTYTAWVVNAAPIQQNMFEIVLEELGMRDRVELVTPDPSGGAIFKNSRGKYVTMPPMPPDSVLDPNIIFDWLEVKEEERADALAVLTELTLMTPQAIDALDDISFAEWIRGYKLPEPVYGFLISGIADSCFVAPFDAVAASEAIRTLQMIFLRSGGLFCKGGIGRVAETFAQAVTENGGKVMMRTRVEKITVDRGSVTGVVTGKGRFHAPVVISNAGIQPTVLKLVGEEHFDRSYVNYVKDLVPSMGLPGARYFLNREVIKNAFGIIFSADSYWTMERFRKAEAGHLPEDIGVLFEVPSNYDPNAAPKGKQIVLASVWGPANPQMPAREKKLWWDKTDEIMFKVFPDLPKHIESKEYYSSSHVSALTRDQVLPNQGGECIGLAQVIGQGGRKKPSIKAPVQGLFYVGCDAGGYGVGTQQAVDSGINVAGAVRRYRLMRKSFE